MSSSTARPVWVASQRDRSFRPVAKQDSPLSGRYCPRSLQDQPIAAYLQSLDTGSDSSMTTLQYADTAFAASPPALPRLEPTRSPQFSPLTTFRAPVRHRDSRYSHCLDRLLILKTIEPRVGGHHSWCAPEPALVLFDRGNQ
jgi:hypothetical protein